MLRALKDRLRAWPWLAGALLAIAVVTVIAPHQLGVLVWALAKLTVGVWLMYWVDRSIFGYARPHALTGGERVHAMYRRAILIAGGLIALALSV
jgi:hypothetical protein